MRLTRDQLAGEGACPEAVRGFECVFGDGVEVTEEVARRHAENFDFYWAARHLLDGAAHEAYRREREALLEWRGRTRARILAERAEALRRYEEQMRQMRAAYLADHAALFARAYRGEL